MDVKRIGMKTALGIFLLLSMVLGFAQNHSHTSTRALAFPDIAGYVTLKTDLHQHTVFSDGEVWPTIRVQEALRDNLDVISLTEHLEYQPHKDDIPHPDRNRAFQLALEEAKEHDLMVINGTEITRGNPIGHCNAVFINDANRLMEKDSVLQFAEAKRQGAFVFWNHPNWSWLSPTGNPIWTDFQEERLKKGELHGIEVINTGYFDDASLALALKHDLTIMGTSDVHGLVEWDYMEKGNSRPITLVFAKEKTETSLKEALFAGRTVAVFNELLVGKQEVLVPLLEASVHIEKASYLENSKILEIQLKNSCSSRLLLENATEFSFYGSPPLLEIAAGETKVVQIKTLEILDTFSLKLKAIACYTAPKKHPIAHWEVVVE